MLKKITAVFLRDLKVNTREMISIYILVVPVLFAIFINLLTPGINDTTVRLAMIDGDNPAQVEYLENFANVSLFKNAADVEERVGRRDNFIGILPEGDGYYIFKQGNEPEYLIDFTKLLKTLFETGASLGDSAAEIVEFGRETPPLKKMLVNISILFSSVLGGMMITLNVVEEKADNTISAMNVSPISRTGFILGKSLMGVTMPIYGSLAILLITGYGGVNVAQMLLLILSAAILSMMIGFIEGLNNDDMMTAAGSFKLVFMPLAGAIAAAEALSEKWQWVAWWVPYYWAYKGNDSVLSQSSTWGQILLYTGIILGMCGLVYLILAPRIRAGLEKG
ncbi:MAG: ABC transporter permease [Clostridia bacterium]|nr:ABC transporter permease [Clostridia bacterium]